MLSRLSGWPKYNHNYSYTRETCRTESEKVLRGILRAARDYASPMKQFK